MTEPREIVVLSGKGGTGKTSLSAALALVAEDVVVADADVDAADLHLLLAPTTASETPFVAGHEARIRQEDCLACGACLARCRFGAVRREGGGAGEARFRIEPLACEGCGVCVDICPVEAIDFPECECGVLRVGASRAGPMVHARLHPGAENSGKLVTAVRTEARRMAVERGAATLLVDGPPGIGCPVIAALGGADAVLLVTEPTPAGEHDLERVLELAGHFGVPASVCINKWDLHPGGAERIAALAATRGAAVLGRLPYSPAFTEAQKRGETIVDGPATPLSASIRSLWDSLKGMNA